MQWKLTRYQPIGERNESGRGLTETGKRDDDAYRKLCMQHGETVSPDRKAIYESSMKKIMILLLDKLHRQ